MGQFFLKFPKIKQFRDITIDRCRRDGYITTFMNRKRFLSDINSTVSMLSRYSLAQLTRCRTFRYVGKLRGKQSIRSYKGQGEFYVNSVVGSSIFTLFTSGVLVYSVRSS